MEYGGQLRVELSWQTPASSRISDMDTVKLVPSGVLTHRDVGKSEVTPESSEFDPASQN